MLNKIPIWTAKTRALVYATLRRGTAYPPCLRQASLHRDYFSAKATGRLPYASSGNATSPYCDPRIKDLTNNPGPFNPDSYLLISAGADGKFGTTDDLANFTVNP